MPAPQPPPPPGANSPGKPFPCWHGPLAYTPTLSFLWLLPPLLPSQLLPPPLLPWPLLLRYSRWPCRWHDGISISGSRRLHAPHPLPTWRCRGSSSPVRPLSVAAAVAAAAATTVAARSLMSLAVSFSVVVPLRRVQPSYPLWLLRPLQPLRRHLLPPVTPVAVTMLLPPSRSWCHPYQLLLLLTMPLLLPPPLPLCCPLPRPPLAHMSHARHEGSRHPLLLLLRYSRGPRWWQAWQRPSPTARLRHPLPPQQPWMVLTLLLSRRCRRCQLPAIISHDKISGRMPAPPGRLPSLCRPRDWHDDQEAPVPPPACDTVASGSAGSLPASPFACPLAAATAVGCATTTAAAAAVACATATAAVVTCNLHQQQQQQLQLQQPALVDGPAPLPPQHRHGQGPRTP